MNNKKKGIFLRALRETMGNITRACEKANIARGTYYLWMDNDLDFAQEVRNVEAECVDFAESKLKSLINDGNPTAIIFYLKTKGKDRGYIEYKKVESENEIRVDLPKIDLELVGGQDE